MATTAVLTYPPKIGRWPKSDLQREAGRKPLDYCRLISTLDLIDGEPVIVSSLRAQPTENPYQALPASSVS